VPEAEVGHHAGTRDGHRVDRRHARRQRDQCRGRRERLLGVPAAHAGGGPDAGAGPRLVDAGAERGDDPGHLAAGDVIGLEAVGREGAAADEGVDAADADRLGGDHHLPGGRPGVGNVDDGQAAGLAVSPHCHCFHSHLPGFEAAATVPDAPVRSG
jgi:hypothetical protein